MGLGTKGRPEHALLPVDSLAYERYVRKPGIAGYLAVFIALALGLMAKPMLVTVPPLLLSVGLVAAGSVIPSRTRIAAASGKGAACRARRGLHHNYLDRPARMGAMSMLGEPVPFPARLANALTAYIIYLEQMVWPAGLTAFYPFQLGRPWWQPVGAGPVAGWGHGNRDCDSRRRPYLLTGWFWYLGTMVPVIGFVQVGAHATADRYAYIPSIGIFIMAAWGLRELVSRWPALRSGDRRIACGAGDPGRCRIAASSPLGQQ